MRQIPDQYTFLLYEVYSSGWWVKHISNDYLQNWISKYFAWKVKRKYSRFIKGIELGDKLRREGKIPNTVI